VQKVSGNDYADAQAPWTHNNTNLRITDTTATETNSYMRFQTQRNSPSNKSSSNSPITFHPKTGVTQAGKDIYNIEEQMNNKL